MTGFVVVVQRWGFLDIQEEQAFLHVKPSLVASTSPKLRGLAIARPRCCVRRASSGLKQASKIDNP